VSLSPLTFTGVSQFSSDLQTILDRAVQIAQIPVKALQNKDADVLQQKALLGGLNSAVSDLAGSLVSLGTTASNRALGATSSNPAAAAVAVTGAKTPASYTINSITSAATAASERTVASFADSSATPVSATGTMTLAVGAQSYTFTLTNNNLVALRDQINSLGAHVTASILTTSVGNYLSVAADSTGRTNLQLFDDHAGANTNLLTNTGQGTNAVFQLNGIDISQPGNVVNNVIPGVTFTVAASSAAPVTLSLASDRGQLSSALEDFVTKYNSLQTQLKPGVLSGDTAVMQLQNVLRQIISYRTSSGSVKTLADLGIEFNSTGQASFNQNTFDGLTDTQISDAFQYLGSTTTGLGGFSTSLSQFSDPISGLIKMEQDGIDRTDRSFQDQIDTLNDRINVMQKSLAARLHAADALLAGLQSQQQELNSTLQSLSLVLYGKNQTRF
jgi:flagellar hook-associated protein 2